MSGILGEGAVFIEGHLVSQKVSQVVQAIKEYEPEIDVDFIPVQARTNVADPAFRIVHRPVGQPEFILFFVKDESEFDERVLRRIIMNDQRNGEHTLSEFEAHEEAVKRIEHEKFLDKMEEMHDIASHVLNTHKNTYVVNKDLVIKEGIPFNAKNLKD